MIPDEDFVTELNNLLEYLTPRQVAEDLGVPAPTIERWSTGKNLPFPAARGAYFKALNEHPFWDEM